MGINSINFIQKSTLLRVQILLFQYQNLLCAMFAVFLFILAATVTTAVDVVPLVDGLQNDVANSQHVMVTLSTLIKDGDNTIVVDAPPSQTAAEQQMLDG